MLERAEQDYQDFHDLQEGGADPVNPANPDNHVSILTANPDSLVSELTGKVIGCAMSVHSELGPGYLEKVYENAMVVALTEAGIRVQQQVPVKAMFHEVVVGDFIADLLVDDWLIVELKAVTALAVAHEVQLVSYLKATRHEVGLLINFGAASLQFKRKYRNTVGRKQKQKQDYQDFHGLQEGCTGPVDPANPDNHVEKESAK